MSEYPIEKTGHDGKCRLVQNSGVKIGAIAAESGAGAGGGISA
jgi:hypothetical protein